jgi:ribonuclease P protein component
MSSPGEKLSKSERLCSKKVISELFENGSSFFNKYFQVIWIKSPYNTAFRAQVAFSVSKKRYRLAVRRNLIKRRTREAYRKNKYLLYDFLDENKIRVAFILIFKYDTIPDYDQFEESVREVIRKLTLALKLSDQIC